MQRRVVSSSSESQNEQVVPQQQSKTRGNKGQSSIWSILQNECFLALVFLAIFIYMVVNKNKKFTEMMEATEVEQECTFMYNATDGVIVPSERHTAIIATHHRTGTQLFFGMMRMFALSYGYNYYQFASMDLKEGIIPPSYVGVRPFSNKQIIVAQHGFAENCVEGHEDKCEWFDADCYLQLCTLSLPEKNDESEFKLAQVVRNPVEIVISSYLYHKQDPPPEAWVGEPKPELIPDNYQRFKTRPYNQFLIMAPPEVALITEFSRQLGELYILARNYRDMKNVQNAINIKFEEVRKDFISGCKSTFEFLRIMHPTMCREQFEEFLQLGFNLQHIDLSVYENVTKVSSHVTEGKHNKRQLAQILYNNKDSRRILTTLGNLLDYENPFSRLSSRSKLRRN